MCIDALLPFAVSGASIGHGMLRAHVIATEAESTIVSPCRAGVGATAHGDVSGGALARTFAAAYAGIGDMETCRRHEKPAEERSEHAGFHNRHRAWAVIIGPIALWIGGYIGCDVLNCFACFGEFSLGESRGVNVKAGEAYIGVWHSHAVDSAGAQALAAEQATPLPAYGAGVVAIGDDCVMHGLAHGIVGLHRRYELLDNRGYAPGIDGEGPYKRFMILEAHSRELHKSVSAQLNDLLIEQCCKLPGDEQGVACA